MAGETDISTDIADDEILPVSFQLDEISVRDALAQNSSVEARMLAKLKGLGAIPDPITSSVDTTGFVKATGVTATVTKGIITTAILGDSSATAGQTGIAGFGGNGGKGVYGESQGTVGAGVYGKATAAASFGVAAENTSSSGQALRVITGYIDKPRVTGHRIELWLNGTGSAVAYEYRFFKA